MAVNRQYVLARRPEGVPVAADFTLRQAPIPAPGEGEVLVRNRYVSVDPGMRARLSAARSYAPPLEIGEVIEGTTLGEVVESRVAGIAPGQLVATGLGWQDWGVVRARAVSPVPAGPLPPTTAIGVLGIPGLTAYFGLLDLGALAPGERVLISSAAGTVGTVAGQIARLKGASAVGIAGGAEKCAWLKDTVGFAGAIDRHAVAAMGAALDESCPDGIDIFFDNVGGRLFDAVVPRMTRGGRIILSGQIAEYNLPPDQRHGVRDTLPFIGQRLRMEGLVVFDYARRFAEAREEMGGWIASGDLVYREEISEGIEGLPEAFIGLFRGRSFGRRLVRLMDDEVPATAEVTG